MTPEPHKNGAAPAQLHLEPMQVCALVIIEGLAAGMQAAINQLGGFLKLPREADIVANAMGHLQRDKERLMQEWQRRLVVAPAGAIIDGKTL